LPERHFKILEVLLSLWNDKKNIVEQDLVNKLCNNPSWSFFKTSVNQTVSTGLTEDIHYLHARGYLFEDERGIIYPTKRAALVYMEVYGEFPTGFS
jgi:hypothetical protein